jgi:hypothetical protein
MPLSNDERKIIETRALTAARNADVPIPMREISGEEPDFRFYAGALGVEVSELLRPASSNRGIVPVAAESYHGEILRMAREEYSADPDAKPVKIVLYFADAEGKKSDKCEMARILAKFVRANVPQQNSIANFVGLELREGFGSMSIALESGDWWCGECGGVSVADIQEALALSIDAKNKRLPTYRENLPPGAEI